MTLQLDQNSRLNYPTLVGDSPFVKEFNHRQSEYWVRTGRTLPISDLIDDILISDYNERHAQ